MIHFPFAGGFDEEIVLSLNTEVEPMARFAIDWRGKTGGVSQTVGKSGDVSA